MTTTRTAPWGAGASDWTHFAQQLGLLEDLLPVVSKPDAVISAGSSMKQLGKTPSTFNRAGEAVGIPKWTEHRSTDRDVKRWAGNADLGICVQTRTVRAIDIDIEDGVQAQRVLDVIETALDELQLPKRWRVGSGKCLLAFRMPGTFVKRIIRTAHGAIEFLATGQQFVALGTHPKGERYQWSMQHGDEALPGYIPELTPAQFEPLWAALQDIFGIEPEITGKQGMRPSTAREAGAAVDAVVDFLDAAGMVRSWERDGRVNVLCPWQDEHTSDSGETATQWFPRGVGGFDQGHFKCLHAHCAGRSDQDFMDAVGFAASEFEVVGPAVDVNDAKAVATLPAVDRPLPVFQRKRNGAILGSIVNIRRALERPDVIRRHLAWDHFRAELMVATWSEATEGQPHLLQWRSFTDNDYADIRLHLEGVVGFEGVAKEQLRDIVRWVGERNAFDSAIEWLTHRVPAWDGVPRIDGFFTTYMDAESNAYTCAVAAYLWTGLAGRALCGQAGCKADMVPVLISIEGTGKTTAVEALAPAPDFATEIDLGKRDDDLSRQMRGKLVGEIAELRGLQSRDEDSIKAWVTRRFEEWTPKYQEFAVRFARRLMFIGTANKGEFLPNDGGAARRWLPLAVGRLDKAALEEDRNQLWAEARERFKANGVEWQKANTLGKEARDDHRVQDEWHSAVEGWLAMGEMDDPNGPSRGLKPVTTTDVLMGAIGVPLLRIGRKEQERMASVLKALGYVRRKPRLEGRGTPKWAYCPTEACDFLHGQLAVSVDDVSDLV